MRICTVDECAGPTVARGLCNKHYIRLKKWGDVNRTAWSRTPSERFWSRVDKSDGCWKWTGGINSITGYGGFGPSAEANVLAHRFAYEDAVGPIPAGMVIDHMCYQKSCVKPEHLRAVTHKQNVENQSVVRSDNRYGLRGVGLNPRTNKYRARVRHNGRDMYAGEHATPEEAAEAAKQLRLSLFTHNDLDRKSA